MRLGAMARINNNRRLHPVEKVDVAVAEAVLVDEKSPPGRLLARFAEIGDQPPLLILSAAVFGAGLAGGHRRLTRTGLRMLAAHLVSNALKGFIKDEVDRTRPGVAVDDAEQPYRLTKGRSKTGKLRSMPSGHSAGLTAVARAFSREYPEHALPVGAAAGTVMLAQLPAGNHFVSDVLAGSLVGFASDWLVDRAMGPVELA